MSSFNIIVTHVIKQEKKFTKIYLSNVIGYSSFSKIVETFKEIAQHVSSGMLIYIANQIQLWNASQMLKKDFLPLELRLDKELTEKARQFDNHKWAPAVFKRV